MKIEVAYRGQFVQSTPWKLPMQKRSIRNYCVRAYCGVLAIAIIPLGTAHRARAQAPLTAFSFEVATVKPVLSNGSHRFDPSRYGPKINLAGASYSAMTVRDLIGYAYGVKLFQVEGPRWATADRFDIEARFPEGADLKDDRILLQALLKDRFKLALHIEKRELESYALVIGKGGLKATQSPPDPVQPEASVPVNSGDPSIGRGLAKSKTNAKTNEANTSDRENKAK